MIIEHRTYKIKPGKLNELMDLYEKEGMEVHKKILGNQIGYFYTEIGPLNEIVHLYGHFQIMFKMLIFLMMENM